MKRIFFTIALFLIHFCIFSQNIIVEIEELSEKIPCYQEDSFQGFFCESKENYLIIRSFGDSYTVFGQWGKDKKEKHFNLKKMRTKEGKLLYQKNEEKYFWEGKTYRNTQPVFKDHETLGKKFNDLLLLETEIVTSTRTLKGRKLNQGKFKEFLAKKLKEIKKRKKEILKNLYPQRLKVSLSSGKDLYCNREKTDLNGKDFDLSSIKKTGEPALCGIYQCGKDEKGNERSLFYLPQHGFSRMLFIGDNKFLNGPTVKMIRKEGVDIPLIFNNFSNKEVSFFPWSAKTEVTRKNFVPKILRDQSVFFLEWTKDSLELSLRTSGRFCDKSSWEDFNKALEDFEEKRVTAKLIQYITILDDAYVGYYLAPDRVPRGSCEQNGIFYNPKIYKEAISLRPSLEGKAISLDRANELFDYAKGMKDIDWNYLDDGCFARAHLMAKRMEAKGVYVGKAWLKGDLEFKKKNLKVLWNFHVAPFVYVKTSEGGIEKYIIDPVTFDRPVKVKKWGNKLTKSSEEVEVRGFPFPENAGMFKRDSLSFSSSKPYLPDDPLGRTEKEKMEMAKKTMKQYMGE